MTESSEDKTKRAYLHRLTAYTWSYQHAVFYQDYTESIRLLTDMAGFKQILRRRCPDQPFLIRIQLLNRGKNLQAYLNILTTQKTEVMHEIVDKSFSAPVNAIGRRCSPERIRAMAEKIRRQKPHNLERFFAKPQVRRWALLNKELLIPVRSGRHDNELGGAI